MADVGPVQHAMTLCGMATKPTWIVAALTVNRVHSIKYVWLTRIVRLSRVVMVDAFQPLPVMTTSGTVMKAMLIAVDPVWPVPMADAVERPKTV